MSDLVVYAVLSEVDAEEAIASGRCSVCVMKVPSLLGDPACHVFCKPEYSKEVQEELIQFGSMPHEIETHIEGLSRFLYTADAREVFDCLSHPR